jgi:pimeloyl-ACP methyl ester carboxylesterase
LLPVPYTSILEEACHANDWSLVQPVLSSSYLGFGHGSLDRDVNELEELLEYLMNHRNGKAFAIVGHSTGCQDAVCFLEKALPKVREMVKVVALQAPVSDREGSELEEGFFEKLATSEEMVKNDRGDDMLPRSHHWAPITAQRFVDLHSRGGKDDYFSNDYTNDELEGRLKHVGAPRGGNHPCLDVLVAFSGADQYVPAPIDKRKLTERLVDAMNSGGSGSNRAVAKALYIENGDHNLSDPGDARIFVDKFTELLEKASEI